MGGIDDINKQASDIVEMVKTTVGDLVDQQGDNLAGVVDKVTDVIDQSTGGGASALTAKLDGTVAGAVDTATTASATVLAKAGEVAGAVKDAVTGKADQS